MENQIFSRTGMITSLDLEMFQLNIGLVCKMRMLVKQMRNIINNLFQRLNYIYIVLSQNVYLIRQLFEICLSNRHINFTRLMKCLLIAMLPYIYYYYIAVFQSSETRYIGLLFMILFAFALMIGLNSLKTWLYKKIKLLIMTSQSFINCADKAEEQ